MWKRLNSFLTNVSLKAAGHHIFMVNRRATDEDNWLTIYKNMHPSSLFEETRKRKQEETGRGWTSKTPKSNVSHVLFLSPQTCDTVSPEAGNCHRVQSKCKHRCVIKYYTPYWKTAGRLDVSWEKHMPPRSKLHICSVYGSWDVTGVHVSPHMISVCNEIMRWSDKRPLRPALKTGTFCFC